MASSLARDPPAGLRTSGARLGGGTKCDMPAKRVISGKTWYKSGFQANKALSASTQMPVAAFG